MTEFAAFFGPGVRSNCRPSRWDKGENNKAKAKTPIVGLNLEYVFDLGTKCDCPSLTKDSDQILIIVTFSLVKNKIRDKFTLGKLK